MRRIHTTSLSRLLGLFLLVTLGAGSAQAARELPAPSWASDEVQGEQLQVFYTRFGPGDDVPSWWGHAALGVQDLSTGQARLYNYGNFAFDQQMLARYAMGRLEFWVADASVNAYLRFYQRLNRDVDILVLNLSPEARKRMARHLADNVLPENRSYLYDHYRDNCSTRLRDAVDVGTGGRLRELLSAPGRMTLREHTRRYTAVNPAMSFLLDLAMNDTIDQPLTRWDEAFLPDELERGMRELMVEDADGRRVPLVASTQTVHAAEGRSATPEVPPNHIPWLLLLGVLYGALPLAWAFWWQRGARAGRILLGAQTLVTGLVFGVVGLLLTLMWAFTDHVVVYRNENLSLVHPLWLATVWLGASLMRGRNPHTARRLLWLGGLFVGVALLWVLLKVLPGFDQNNWNVLALLLPIVVGHGAAWARVALAPGTAPEAATAG
ncbi:MAG TPA: DUF4105 domain-containing protein [Myxococcaceae bacterium]|nr:DUF4105 domain-containing protein [Myxococcaceae bacterium]